MRKGDRRTNKAIKLGHFMFLSFLNNLNILSVSLM